MRVEALGGRDCLIFLDLTTDRLVGDDLRAVLFRLAVLDVFFFAAGLAFLRALLERGVKANAICLVAERFLAIVSTSGILYFAIKYVWAVVPSGLPGPHGGALWKTVPMPNCWSNASSRWCIR